MKLFVFVISLVTFAGTTSWSCETYELKASVVPCIAIEWSDGAPKKSVNSPFVVTFKELSGQAFDSSDIRVKTWLWMEMPNGHAHGSKPTTTTLYKRSGLVHVDQVWFVMKGKWQIKVFIEKLDQNQKVLESEEIIFEETISN